MNHIHAYTIVLPIGVNVWRFSAKSEDIHFGCDFCVCVVAATYQNSVVHHCNGSCHVRRAAVELLPRASGG